MLMGSDDLLGQSRFSNLTWADKDLYKSPFFSESLRQLGKQEFSFHNLLIIVSKITQQPNF